MKKFIFSFILLILVVIALFFLLNKYIYDQKQGEVNMTSNEIEITPIEHATLALKFGGKTILTDPIADAETFKNQSNLDLILVTDIHGDHLNIQTLEALAANNTMIIAPQAVFEELSDTLKNKTKILANGEVIKQDGLAIQAVAMYNYPEKADSYHTKGRGNGYILEANGKRIYISGDTGNTPELQALQDIDIAFLSMNLPYTMSVEDAAQATLAFKPKQVYPYHYRTPEGYSDVNKFKELVNSSNPDIEVILADWYPNK